MGIRRVGILFLACLLGGGLALLAACAAPAPQAAGSDRTDGAGAPDSRPQPSRPGGKPEIGQPVRMPPLGGPLPPDRLPAPPSTDRSCRTDADCVVKDVGNCCGRFPACVNRDSPTDPAAVKARCEAEGRSAVCGFNEISACHCVRGTCADEREPVGGWIDDPAPPPTRER